MIARLLRWILLGQAVCALLVAAWLQQSGRIASPWLALLAGLGAVLLARLAITANNFWMAHRYGSPTPPAFALDAKAALRLFISEYFATLRHSSWTMMLGRARVHQYPPSSYLPVLLVHGYACNSGYWHHLQRALEARAVTYATVDLEPIGASIDDYAPQIDAALRALPPGPVLVVAHSMGGLAMRAYCRRFGAERVARLITLGTPHHGTRLAHFGPGRNARQMQLDSEWLRELAASETPALRRRIVSIYSHHDNIIAPQTSSELEHTESHAFGGIGHVALASDPGVLEAVLTEMNRVAKAIQTGPD